MTRSLNNMIPVRAWPISSQFSTTSKTFLKDFIPVAVEKQKIQKR